MVKNELGLSAKTKLVELAKAMDLRLEKYWNEEIDNNFGFNETQRKMVRVMLLHAKEHNLRAAKRARAGFVVWGYKLKELENSRNQEFKTNGGDIWKVAEGIELVHTALLMHDDFMDEDLVRRGEPTTQVFFGGKDKHFGEAMAVNVGDSVLCLGYERILNSGFEGNNLIVAMRQMLRGITNTAYGQAYDVSLPSLGEMTEEKVMSLHRAKTGIYTYENPLTVGAILAGLSEDVKDILREYSEKGGVAFQLQDDILGVFGNEDKTGKSANSDLLQGKVTLLIVKVLELGTRVQKEAVMKVWGKKAVEEKDIEIAKKAIKDSGSYDYSVKAARELNEKSIEIVQKLRKLNLNSEAIDYLEGVARYMMEREM
jgi:geranylgeranyl diphosphate synthase type I